VASPLLDLVLLYLAQQSMLTHQHSSKMGHVYDLDTASDCSLPGEICDKRASLSKAVDSGKKSFLGFFRQEVVFRHYAHNLLADR
jgi:hypothetical protein